MHQFGTHRIGEAADRRFGATVSGLQRNGTVGQRGSHLDNHASVAGHHQLQRGASAVDKAEVGHVSHTTKLIRRKGAKRCQHGAHGIVNPHVNRPKAILNLVSRIHHRLTVGDVRLHRVGIDPKAL